eukprot:TRINITY_DN21938_c0_g1_i1.p1 TRINITY_DN21938_c0_g1~~TRINITY_DN21938_c0_g1_i1.p1  ORF type:complete len:475 (+),score=74.86 TRINITY_DN21938_c0_g1_i1:108-1532(+)
MVVSKIGSRVLRPAAAGLGFGVGSMANRVASLLRQHKQKVAAVESTSGGLLNAALLSLPGASSYYCGPGVVVYGTSAAGPRETLRTLIQDDSGFAAVSNPYRGDCADEYVASKELWSQIMSERMCKRLDADWCVAESGATGPTFNVVGVQRAFSAISVHGPVKDAVIVEAPTLDREANMPLFAEAALTLLADCIVAAHKRDETTDDAKDAAAPKVIGLSWKVDRYNGIVAEVDSEAVTRPGHFVDDLDAALATWQASERAGVWVRVPLGLAACIPTLASRGFEYHHARGDYCMLTRWLRGAASESKFPKYAGTQVGVGACVLNSDGKVLVVKESVAPSKKAQGLWKMPGGLADPGEDIAACAIREVQEETGIDAEFESIICFRHAHGLKFGVSDLYFLVKCRALSERVSLEREEIAEVAWKSHAELLALGEDGLVSETNRAIIDVLYSERPVFCGRAVQTLSGTRAMLYEGSAR